MSYTTVHYMSRNAALHLDLPIDDPYGGPAYGQKLKGGGGLGKIVGVVAAVAAVSTGYGLVALGGQGALAGGAMMAGGIMSGIGTITGNKKLTQIGGVLTLAGGAYGMAFDKAGSFALGKEGTTSMMSEASANAISKFNDTFGSKLDTGLKTQSTLGLDPSTNAVGLAQGGAGEAATSAFSVPSTSATTPGLNLSDNPLTKNIVGTPVDTGATIGLSQSGSPGLVAGNSGIQTPGLSSVATGVKSASGGGITNGAMDLAKNMSTGTGQIIGSTIQGLATGSAGNAQAEQMAQQTSLLATKYANDQNELQRQIKNMNSMGAIYYNPNDPNAQKIIAAAQANGTQTIPLSVNMNANVQSPTAAFQGAKA